MKNQWRRDIKLKELTDKGVNIAQFISINPNNIDKAEEMRVLGLSDEDRDIDIKFLIKTLINNSSSDSINIKSFSKEKPRGNPLIMGKKEEDMEEILNIIKNNSKKREFTILHEHIDINDGGVSGIIMGDLVEFKPETTPDCVEGREAAKLPYKIFKHLCKVIYGLDLGEIDVTRSHNRIEFSIHPDEMGYQHKRYSIWNYYPIKDSIIVPKITTQNTFSRFIGEKVYGLLILDALGFKVPMTEVTHYKLNQFYFGQRTGNYNKWTRTAPMSKEAGKYETVNTFQNPSMYLKEINQKELKIVSVLVQEEVKPEVSGSMLISKDDFIFEGVHGDGRTFMKGKKSPEKLEDNYSTIIEKFKREELKNIINIIKNFQIEWVIQGNQVWVVQLNTLDEVFIDSTIIYPGRAKYWINYPVEAGLEPLRKMVEDLEDDIGVILQGDVGITSHFGDILRKEKVVSKINK